MEIEKERKDRLPNVLVNIGEILEECGVTVSIPFYVSFLMLIIMIIDFMIRM